MTHLEFIGAIAIGALSVLVALLGVVVYWARNHRIDLSGLAIRREWWHRTEDRPAASDPALDRMQALLDESFRTDGEKPPDWSPKARGIQHGARTEARGEDK